MDNRTKFYVVLDTTLPNLPVYVEAASAAEAIVLGRANFGSDTVELDPRFIEPFHTEAAAIAALYGGSTPLLSEGIGHRVSASTRPSDISRPSKYTRQAAGISGKIKATVRAAASREAAVNALPDNAAETDHNKGTLPDNRAEIDTQRRVDVQEPKPASSVQEVLQRARQLASDVGTISADDAPHLGGEDIHTIAIAGPDTFGLAGKNSEAMLAEVHEMLMERVGEKQVRIITTLNRGFDMVVAEAAMNLRDAGMPITVDILVPFKSRPSLWGDPREFYDLLERADKVSYDSNVKGTPTGAKAAVIVEGALNNVLMSSHEVITYNGSGMGETLNTAEALGLDVFDSYKRLAAAGIEAEARRSVLTPPTAANRAPMVVVPSLTPSGPSAPLGVVPRKVMQPYYGGPIGGEAGSPVGDSVGHPVGNSGARGPGNAGTPPLPPSSMGKAIQPASSQSLPILPPPPPIHPPDSKTVATRGPAASPAHTLSGLVSNAEFMQLAEQFMYRPRAIDIAEAIAREAQSRGLTDPLLELTKKHLLVTPNSGNLLTIYGMTDRSTLPDPAAGFPRRPFDRIPWSVKAREYVWSDKAVPHLAPYFTPITFTASAEAAERVINRSLDQPTTALPNSPVIPDSTKGGPRRLPGVVDSSSPTPPTIPTAPDPAGNLRSVPHAPDHQQDQVARPSIMDTPESTIFSNHAGADHLSRTVLGAMPGSRFFTGVVGQAMVGSALSQLFTSERYRTDSYEQADRATGAIAETMIGIVGSNPRTGGMILANQMSSIGKYEASRMLAEVAIGATAGIALSMSAEALAKGRGAGAGQMAGFAGGALGWAAGALVAPVVVRAVDRLRGASELQYTDTDMGLLEGSMIAMDSAQRLSDLAARQFEIEFADSDGTEIDMSEDSDMPTSVDEIYDESGDELGFGES